jgi:hypothetical protein
MTDKEMAAIQARWNWILVDALPEPTQAKADIRALLAEVKQLRAECKQARFLLQQFIHYADEPHPCAACGAEWPLLQGHTAECPVTKARALLADTDS